MNVEEFDELINTIPKVESDNPISAMDSINVEENQKLKEQLQQKQDIINKVREYINKCLIVCSILDGKKEYCLNEYKFDYKELLEILDNKGE